MIYTHVLNRDYHPHLTVGRGTRDFVDARRAEPFEAFTFRAVSVSLYQVGDFGGGMEGEHFEGLMRVLALFTSAKHPRYGTLHRFRWRR